MGHCPINHLGELEAIFEAAYQRPRKNCFIKMNKKSEGRKSRDIVLSLGTLSVKFLKKI
jgi:hypothetical protein